MAENFDQTRIRSPFTTVDGSETVVLNQGGETKGGFLSVIRTWILDSLSITKSQIQDSTEFGRSLLELEDTGDLNALVVHPTPYTPPETATQQEIEDGVEEGERMFSPSLLVSAIAYHTRKQIPLSITSSRAITLSDIGMILVCDALDEIDITIPVFPGFEEGSFHVVNLGADPVNIVVSGGATLIDSTGEISEYEVTQYSCVELIYIGDDTWYVGVK